MKNYQVDFIDKLNIYKMRDNTLLIDALKKAEVQCKKKFDCIGTTTDRIVLYPNYKITNDHIIGIVPIERDCDIFRFNKVRLMTDGIFLDDSLIIKTQLVVGGRVIIDDMEQCNLCFPLIASLYQNWEFRVFMDKTDINPQLDTIIVTTDDIILPRSLKHVIKNDLFSNGFELENGTKVEDGWIGEQNEAEGEKKVSVLINQATRCWASLIFRKDSDLIYNIRVQTVDINMNIIKNQFKKVSLTIGGQNLYNMEKLDDYYFKGFTAEDPIPLGLLCYHEVKLDISTHEPDQLILVTYEQKNFKNNKDIINTTIYINYLRDKASPEGEPYLLVSSGLMGKTHDVGGAPHISKFL